MAVVSENRMTPIPRGIPLDIAALLGCAVTTGLGIVCNELQVKMGQSVVVFGCGGVGLNVLQGCMLANAYPIIGIDIVEDKLQQALIAGATHVFLPDNPELKNILGKDGADYVIDTTGQQTVMQTAWELANSTGKVCLVAQMRHDQYLPLRTLPMHSGRAIIGSDGGSTDPSIDIPRYIQLLKSGRLQLSSLITHRVPLTEINAIMDAARSGKVGRAIIEM